MNDWRFIEPPVYVGHWEFGGAQGLLIHLQARPRWLTRVLMLWLFEMRWHDADL